jgi:hypothetical protein
MLFRLIYYIQFFETPPRFLGHYVFDGVYFRFFCSYRYWMCVIDLAGSLNLTVYDHMEDSSYYVLRNRFVWVSCTSNISNLSLRYTVRSKQLIVSRNSFSIVNFTDCCSLLNSLSVCSMLVLLRHCLLVK